jgi:hypothetical protein
MSKPGDKGRGDSRPPLLAAQEWITQITTVVAEMVLPGLAGDWLDHRWGTKFLTLVGFALGLTVGIWHLIVMTRPKTAESGKDPKTGQVFGTDRPGSDRFGSDQPGSNEDVGKDQE